MIERLFAPLATDPGADGLADDAAVLAPRPGEEIVVTLDALAAGVHFFPDDPPETIAAKALRVNLSDLAAKGAEPVGYTLALALGEGWSAAWVERFAAGLAADQARYGISLIGGDTLRAAGGTHVAVTAFGRLPAGTIVRRRTARPGDVLLVTGTLGDAALHLATRFDPARTAGWRLSAADADALGRAYLEPDPPVAAAAAVRRHARGAMDVSDGLLTDARKLVRAAGCAARIDLAAVPLSPAARRAEARDPDVRARAAVGGDDYQILAAVPPEAVDAYRADVAAAGRKATVLGRLEVGEGVTFVRDGTPVALDESGAFHHF